MLGQEVDSAGSITVTGPDARAEFARDIALGNQGGHGELAVLDGATVIARGVSSGIYTGPGGEMASGTIRLSGNSSFL